MKTDRIVALLVASILLTVTSAVITQFAIDDSRTRVEWVFHTYEVIHHAESLISLLNDAETAQRGYIITGDSTLLAPLFETQRRIPAIGDSLLTMLADDSAQHALLQNRILPMAHRSLESVYRVTEIYRRSGQAAAFALMRQGQGRQMMDSLRRSATQFTATERMRLHERLAALTETHERQIWVRYVSFAVILLVSAMALLALVQKQRSNNRLIAQLHDVNETLETKVRDRTAELERKTYLAEKLSRDLQDNFQQLEAFYEALQMRSSRAEDSLQEVRDLYDRAPCGYHSLDANGMIVRMNATELSWLGYTREEVIGRMNITQVIAPSELESYHHDFASFKQRGVIRNKEHTFLRKDGSTFHVLLNATAIYDEAGNYVMSRGSVTDITDRKVVENKFIEANRSLLQLNEEKNHILGIAAHDLKSPLNTILGLINLIRLSQQNLTTDQAEYLRYIEQACTNMQTLVNNLLDLNKIEEGINVLNPESVELGDFLQRHLQVFRERARSKNIALVLEDNAPGKRIITDLNALQRIIENLLSNAIKFSPKGKEVVLRVVHEAQAVRIEVTDQGPGISQHDMPRLFRKFQKLSARPTDGEGSTGLGLSIVKELVQALHGKITVRSEVNKGSTFAVELPVQAAPL